MTDAADYVVEFRMEERLAATDGHDGSSEFGQLVDAAEHDFERDGLREIVVLVAVFAGEVAAPNGDDVREQRMVRRHKGASNFPGSAKVT